MKNIAIFVMIALLASVAYGQNWSPQPMVITVPDVVKYSFDGSSINIPFDLAGKPAQIWLTIQTKLDSGQKPVGITNGFKGWHFVNGIDTTVYVSAGRDYNVGNGLTFPWNGKGSEKQYENLIETGAVPAGEYTFALIGYDNKSDREIANNIIPIGQFSYENTNRFYTKDDKTGATLSQPLLMGTVRNARSGTYSAITNTYFKFRLGDDPYDATKIETTKVFGYSSGDVVPGKSLKFGAGFFDPKDYDTFYFPSSKPWDAVITVVKFTYVSGGEAVQDMTYGDFNKVSWSWPFPGNYVMPGILQTDGENIHFMISNQNPVQYPADRITGFPMESLADDSDVLYETTLFEYYAPLAPVDTGNVARIQAEVGRFDQGPLNGQYYAAGDASCLVELIDCNKLLQGAADAFSSDGSGYLVWGNSNGDYFTDKNSQVEPANPGQLWACQVFEPRNFNTQRQAPSPTDKNGFMLSYLEFAGLFSAALFTPDGSGIGLVRFADDSFSAGGDNTQKKGNGYTIDVEGMYDGIYVLKPMKAEPAWSDASYDATCWFAWDSDSGILNTTGQGTGVEDAEPVAFSVAQNTPNPFNPTTTVNFTLAREGQVSIDVFNVAGQKVATLANDVMTAGSHSVTWDANGFAAGVYFYTVKSGDYSKTMKMTLLK